MKTKNSFFLKFLLILFSAFYMFPSFAQLYTTLPETLDEIANCNNKIAVAFAPIISQWTAANDDHNPDDNFDRIVKVDFDGDWIATNNWENLSNISDYDASPYGYYSVLWTKDLWIILYTFYYARDWASTGLECDEDEHEGDFAKTMVIVKRPSSGSELPEDLLLGFATTKGKKKCLSLYNQYTSSDSLFGAPPFIDSATGSHHYYTAKDDNLNNWCNPFPTDVLFFHPADAFLSTNISVSTSINPILTECLDLVGIDNIIYQSLFLCEAGYGDAYYYGLIDIFDPISGLWNQRGISSLFTQPTDITKQRLQCDNGAGCGESDFIYPFTELNQDQSPWAPWTGSFGVNPLIFIHDEFNNTFGCNDEYTVTSCLYEYNPFLCDLYEVIMYPTMFTEEGDLVSNPLPDGDDLIIRFHFHAVKSISPNAEVTWSWELPDGIDESDVTCEGCDEKESTITLTIKNAIQAFGIPNTNTEFIVTAEIKEGLLECSDPVKDELVLLVEHKNFITNTDCDQTKLEVDPAYHLSGNIYEWQFLGYEDLATYSDGDKVVTFSTSALKQFAEDSEVSNTPTDETPQYLFYLLKISNEYESAIKDELYGIIQLPECHKEGGLKMIIYPSPASETINIFLEGKALLNQKDFEYTILDHQLNLVKKQTCPIENGTIDISELNSGFLLTQLENDRL